MLIKKFQFRNVKDVLFCTSSSSLSSTIPYHLLIVFSVICTYQTALVRQRIVEGEGSISRECFKKNLGKEQTDTERERQRAFFLQKESEKCISLSRPLCPDFKEPMDYT